MWLYQMLIQVEDVYYSLYLNPVNQFQATTNAEYPELGNQPSFVIWEDHTRMTSIDTIEGADNDNKVLLLQIALEPIKNAFLHIICLN
jgi:hypothetical protein